MKQFNNFNKFKILKSLFFIFISLAGLSGLLVAITYTNNSFNQSVDSSTKKLEYVRSPYATEFEIKNTNDLKLIYAMSHFDSVGISKNKNSLNENELESIVKDQGSQEIKEANNIVNVLNFFTEKFKNENIVFMADTNIKLGNESLAFENLIHSKYKMLFEDSEIYNTTLSSIITNKFINPYDKLIYFFDENFCLTNQESYNDIEKIIRPDFQNGFAINTYNTLNNKIIENGIGLINYFDDLYQDSPVGFVRNAISDHLPIGFDLNYLDIYNTNQKLRVGGWNVLNFNLQTGDLFQANFNSEDNEIFKKQLHAINIAKIISYSNFDLIGLLEINKCNSEKDLSNFLKYLNYLSNDEDIYYEAFLSENTPAINENSNQIEKILLIYNKNKVNINYKNETFFYELFNSNYLLFLNSISLNEKDMKLLKEVYFEK